MGLLNLFPTLIFNIQRVIQYSTSHSTFNYSFYIQFLFRPFNNLFNNFNQLFNFKTFNYSFNIQLFWAFTTSGQWHRFIAGKNVAAARMPATKIEAYEDDTRLHFDVESGPPRFLGSVLQRIDHRWVHVYSPEASRRYKLLSNNRFWEKKKQQILYNL